MCWVFFDMMALVSMLFLELLGSIHQRNAASYEQKINIPCSYMGDKKKKHLFILSSKYHAKFPHEADGHSGAENVGAPPPLFPVSFAQQGSCVPATCSSQTF